MSVPPWQHYPQDCWSGIISQPPYEKEFMNELNVERFELLETGRLKFSHPPGTHNDRLWAFALAIYYARLEPTEYHPVAAVNTSPSPGNLFPQLPKSIWKR